MAGTIKVNKLRFAELFVGSETEVTAGTAPDFACQAETWSVVKNTGPGDKGYTFCYAPAATNHPNEGEYREVPPEDWSLTGSFLSDWTAAGGSRLGHPHDQEALVIPLHSFPHDPDQQPWWA